MPLSRPYPDCAKRLQSQAGRIPKSPVVSTGRPQYLGQVGVEVVYWNFVDIIGCYFFPLNRVYKKFGAIFTGCSILRDADWYLGGVRGLSLIIRRKCSLYGRDFC